MRYCGVFTFPCQVQKSVSTGFSGWRKVSASSKLLFSESDESDTAADEIAYVSRGEDRASVVLTDSGSIALTPALMSVAPPAYRDLVERYYLRIARDAAARAYLGQGRHVQPFHHGVAGVIEGDLAEESGQGSADRAAFVKVAAAFIGSEPGDRCEKELIRIQAVGLEFGYKSGGMVN